LFAADRLHKCIGRIHPCAAPFRKFIICRTDSKSVRRAFDHQQFRRNKRFDHLIEIDRPLGIYLIISKTVYDIERRKILVAGILIQDTAVNRQRHIKVCRNFIDLIGNIIGIVLRELNVTVEIIYCAHQCCSTAGPAHAGDHILSAPALFFSIVTDHADGSGKIHVDVHIGIRFHAALYEEAVVPQRRKYEETKKQIYEDIYDDSMWLTNLVENLLYSTRIEEGRMVLKTSPELVSEIIEEAMQHIRPKVKSHSVTTACEDDFLMVRADGKLIVQVIINLVDNALKYTPDDASISITAENKNGMAEIKIADTGRGISNAEKEKIFDKFYSGEHKIADNRRSLGLGLYLCKAIVEAHGGTICVTDNLPHGSVFCFTLPLEEVTIHE